MVTDLGLQRINNKLLTLVTINIFQPVERDYLYDKLQSSIDSEQLNSILDELVLGNRVVLEQQHYRLTMPGYKSIIPNKGRVLRDVNRMHYLADTNFLRGGGP